MLVKYSIATRAFLLEGKLNLVPLAWPRNH